MPRFATIALLLSLGLFSGCPEDNSAPPASNPSKGVDTAPVDSNKK
jgi:hypothetical protein